MKTLAIETSCDDTSLGIVSYDQGVFSIEKIKAYSQIDDHQQYGGVVPEIAFRLHSEQILALSQSFLQDIPEVDSISVTTHPGLAGSLLVGKTVAGMLSHQFQKPLIPVNHIHGHIFSLLLDRNIVDLHFPWVVLTASWWHNEIYLITKEEKINDEKYSHKPPFSLDQIVVTKLWKSLDDAAGECFDKVARMLWWPYPWWAWIGEQALLWKPNKEYQFKKSMLLDHDNLYDFSFSWMKSQVYTLLQRLEREWVKVEWQVLYDISYAFQEAVVEVLVAKLKMAVEQYSAQTVGIAWWVSANDRLFELATQNIWDALSLPVLRPMKKLYSTDNAAMIGVIWLLTDVEDVEKEG